MWNLGSYCFIAAILVYKANNGWGTQHEDYMSLSLRSSESVASSLFLGLGPQWALDSRDFSLDYKERYYLIKMFSGIFHCIPVYNTSHITVEYNK